MTIIIFQVNLKIRMKVISSLPNVTYFQLLIISYNNKSQAFSIDNG